MKPSEKAYVLRLIGNDPGSYQYKPVAEPKEGFYPRVIPVADHPEIGRRVAAGEMQSVIAREYGVSRERIRQIAARFGATGTAAKAVRKVERIAQKANEKSERPEVMRQKRLEQARPFVEVIARGGTYEEAAAVAGVRHTTAHYHIERVADEPEFRELLRGRRRRVRKAPQAAGAPE